ncbi:hypothetical protein NCCP2222_12040 [Sporosarcina sp. NCCP-2222]|uniref:stage II sporulation protein M n=1 Tax=Sporosarcina sp. NCCP-2222 TaxID=2935073 RepID=UPI00208D8FEE|nr:stage II sporulation protein M [Sporosarcina sp. NCCP-2222]GKV55257.1 hypothetical protein NCCP2222_12040 [Sporosarcina sp. NCCP-2222]
MNLLNEVAAIHKKVNKVIFKRAAKFFTLAAIITIAATVITYVINPDLKSVAESFKVNSSDQLRESTGMKKVWTYVANNGFVVPLQMFVFTLIPVQFLYLVNIISTATLPGILFGVILQADSRNGMKIIASTIPHFVLEVFAFCLWAAVLFKLSQVVRSKIKYWFKKNEEEVVFVDTVYKTLKVYLTVVLPMIIVAAFVETYVADLIYYLLQ